MTLFFFFFFFFFFLFFLLIFSILPGSLTLGAFKSYVHRKYISKSILPIIFGENVVGSFRKTYFSFLYLKSQIYRNFWIFFLLQEKYCGGLFVILGQTASCYTEAQVFQIRELGPVQLQLTLVRLVHKLCLVCQNFGHMSMVGEAVTKKLWQTHTI